MLHSYIQFSKKIFIEFFKLFLVVFVLVIFLEILTRLLIFIPTNSNVFKYGIKNSVGLSVVDLSKFQISIFDFDKKIEKKNSNQSINKFWIFGGSTTFGYSCDYKQSSSWPNEIFKINDNFKYKNFAFKGANSDQQLSLLLKEIVSNQPKSILWASKFNTLNILGNSDYENKDILRYNFSNSKQTNLLIYVKKLDKTLKKYSVFYFLFDETIYRLKWKLGFKNKRLLYEPTKKDISYAIKNFEINTLKAIEVSQKFGVKEFLIISLFFDNNFNSFNNLEKYRFSLYTNTIINIRDKYENYVEIIDLDDYFKNYDKSELLCDFAHQTLNGNIIQAEYILDQMKKKSKIINE